MTLKGKTIKAGRSKLAKARKQLTTTELFFFENAGYSYDPKIEITEQGRIRCAKDLAEAETVANRLNWSHEWVWDDSGCSGCACGSENCACSSGAEHETLGCVLKDENGETLESLWGICGATDAYRRVVEAELSSEAVYRMNREIETLDAH